MRVPEVEALAFLGFLVATVWMGEGALAPCTFDGLNSSGTCRGVAAKGLEDEAG